MGTKKGQRRKTARRAYERQDWKKGKREWSLARYLGLRFDDAGTISVQSGPKLYGKAIKGGNISIDRVIGRWK